MGHTYPPFRNWIYLFHMAIFFMASGYCYNHRHSESIREVWNFIISKIKSFYVPYVICNIIYNVCNNLFLRTYIYSNDPMLLKLTENALYPQVLIEYLGFVQIIKCVIKNLLFTGTAKMGGATWFLETLFLVVVGHCIGYFLVKKIFLKNYDEMKPILLVICLAVCSSAIFVLDSINIFSSIRMTWAIIAYVAYLLGMSMKRITNFFSTEKNSLYFVCSAVLSGVILSIANQIETIEISAGDVANPVFCIIVSISGWIFVMSVVKLLPSTLMKGIVYLGQNTMPILILHFLCFKIVSFIYLLVMGKNILLLASFPIIFDESRSMWWIYMIGGILFPVIFNFLYQNMKHKFVYFIYGKM